jgi:PAS domain S-box-containing protein
LALPPLVPRTLGLIRSAKLSDERQEELEAANAALTREIAERRRAEDAVRELAAELEMRVRERTAELARANEALAEKAEIVQHSQDAIFSWELDGTVTSWNPAAEKAYGHSASEATGKRLAELIPAAQSRELSILLASMQQGIEPQPVEIFEVSKDGAKVETRVTVSPLRDAAGSIRGASVIARDITEQNQSEEQLRQVQKLESLGIIAGGVAHDFNNLLVGIMGNASLALEILPRSHPNFQLIESVIKASEKAAHLTQQLLAYAGKGRFVSEKLDLSQMVSEIVTLVETSIPKAVTLRLELESGLPAVEADPGQMQQVIMNLVINGAEAIGYRNGTVLVTTGTQEVDEAYARQNFGGESLPAGTYVSLEIHDSGCGMDEGVKSRIFDPFFTTKFTGRGLGLSAVLGIVRAHKGTIRVYSEPGKGSTFKVLLPSVEGHAPGPQLRDLQEELRGNGLVLVIDDEEVVRSTASSALMRYGYSVITANDGEAGVSAFRGNAGQVAAVLLDMTMPVMDGVEAFRLIRTIQPDAKVIVSSGYSELEAIRRFTAKGIAGFIQKPYTASKLARVMKQVMQG